MIILEVTKEEAALIEAHRASNMPTTVTQILNEQHTQRHTAKLSAAELKLITGIREMYYHAHLVGMYVANGKDMVVD